MAAHANRTRYSRTRAWVRPLAWAATIGLSLALVLEITRVPQMAPDSVGVTTSVESAATPSKAPNAGRSESRALRPAALPPAGADAEVSAVPAAEDSATSLQDDFAPRDMEILQKAQGMAKTQAGSDQARSDTRADIVASPGAGTLPGPGAEPEVSSASAEARAATTQPAPARARAEIAPVQQSPAVTLRKTRAPATAEADTAPVTSSFSALTASDAMAVAAACPDEVRESPESWLDCIRELREYGLDDLAQAELDEFQRIFPDLAESVVDK
jgi:hypothetical protein